MASTRMDPPRAAIPGYRLAGSARHLLTEQDVGRRGGEAVVEAEQQDADAHPEGEDDPDRGVALARPGAEQTSPARQLQARPKGMRLSP